MRGAPGVSDSQFSGAAHFRPPSPLFVLQSRLRTYSSTCERAEAGAAATVAAELGELEIAELLAADAAIAAQATHPSRLLRPAWHGKSMSKTARRNSMSKTARDHQSTLSKAQRFCGRAPSPLCLVPPSLVDLPSGVCGPRSTAPHKKACRAAGTARRAARAALLPQTVACLADRSLVEISGGGSKVSRVSGCEAAKRDHEEPAPRRITATSGEEGSG